MAYTLDLAISLGSSKTGLTLNAQIVDTSGVDVGSAITTGFTEVGTGTYLLHYTAVPDSHRGGIKFYESGAPGTVLAFGAINPEEAEYVDQKLSTTESNVRGADSDDLKNISDEVAALNDPTAAVIADAVWDEISTGHVDAGKAGEQLWTDVDAVLADTNELQTDDVPSKIADLITRTKGLDDIHDDLVTVDSVADAILVDTGTDGVVVATASKTGYRLSGTGVDDILDEAVEGTYTLRQLLRLLAAVLVGKSSGGGTTSITFRNLDDDTDRVVATVDTSGNRTSVTLNGG